MVNDFIVRATTKISKPSTKTFSFTKVAIFGSSSVLILQKGVLVHDHQVIGLDRQVTALDPGLVLVHQEDLAVSQVTAFLLEICLTASARGTLLICLKNVVVLSM